MKNILLFSLLLITGALQAQSIEQYSIAIFDQTFSAPFVRFSPINIGAEVGATLKQTESDKSTRQWNAYAGFYHHEYVEIGLYLRGEYLYRFKLGKIGVDAMGGLGYLHSFYPGEVYEQDSSTGEYSTATPLGRPHALANLGIGLTYLTDGKFEPFIRQELGIETPFGGEIPLVPHSFVKLGVNLKF